MRHFREDLLLFQPRVTPNYEDRPIKLYKLLLPAFTRQAHTNTPNANRELKYMERAVVNAWLVSPQEVTVNRKMLQKTHPLVCHGYVTYMQCDRLATAERNLIL